MCVANPPLSAKSLSKEGFFIQFDFLKEVNIEKASIAVHLNQKK